jgi:D-sedoheptulose 7-phosphate isomerase
MSWRESLTYHQSVAAVFGGVLSAQFDPAVTMLCRALVAGKKILLCGNGGSAAMASHLAAELVGRFKLDRKAYPAISLTDLSNLTAIGNDYGYQRTFARQVEAFGTSGDVLIAMSTSGKSPNVLAAIVLAKHRGMQTLGLCGSLPMNCDVDLTVPTDNTATIQEMHLLAGHLLIEGIEELLPK